MTEKTPEARLDAHARAIRELRAAVARLEAALAQVPGATDSTEPDAGWQPKPDCLVCGAPKEPGRDALTCRPCGTARQRIIVTKGADRSSLVSTVCGQCGAVKPRSSRILCAACSAAFKVWKAAH